MKPRKLHYPEDMLVRLLKEQHPNGARALYDMYSPALFGVISRIIPEQAMAEDVLQETFIRVWQSFPRYQADKGRLFTWMVNIARNLAIDGLRSKCYRVSRQTQGLDNCEALPVINEQSDHRLDAQLIRKGMMRLRMEERQVMNLVYNYGYTHLEAAEALSLPLGTVKTRLVMAVRRLKKYYQDDLAKAG